MALPVGGKQFLENPRTSFFTNLITSLLLCSQCLEFSQLSRDFCSEGTSVSWHPLSPADSPVHVLRLSAGLRSYSSLEGAVGPESSYPFNRCES